MVSVAEPAVRQPHQLHVSAPPPFALDSVIALACSRSPRRPPAPPTARAAGCRPAAPAPPAPWTPPRCVAPPRRSAGPRPSINVGSRGAGTASTTASACQRCPSSSTSSQPRCARLTCSTATCAQRIPARRTSSSTSTAYPPSTAPNTDRGGGPALATASRTASVRLRAPAVQRCCQCRSGRPQADRGRGPGVHARQQRVDRAGHHLLAEPVADQFGDRRIGARPPDNGRVRSSSIRAIVASSTSPASRPRLRRDALQGVRRQRVQPAPAVDQRPHAGGADLPDLPGPARPAARAPPACARRTPRRRRPSAGRRSVPCAAPRRAGRPGRTP